LRTKSGIYELECTFVLTNEDRPNIVIICGTSQATTTLLTLKVHNKIIDNKKWLTLPHQMLISFLLREVASLKLAGIMKLFWKKCIFSFRCGSF